ncbi:MAG: hypothetical protein P8Y67_14590 [Alphaproteobacteria bacterium]
MPAPSMLSVAAGLHSAFLQQSTESGWQICGIAFRRSRTEDTDDEPSYNTGQHGGTCGCLGHSEQ